MTQTEQPDQFPPPPLHQRRLVVLFGSQTGTAEDVAHQIARRARRLHLTAEVCSMDAYLHAQIFDEPAVVFVCSTAGQGAMPANMARFWTSLRRASLPADFLAGVRFTVFGLGDSAYPRFNWAAKKLYRRLLQLGATCFYGRGEADDQNLNGVDSTLVPWMDGLCQVLLELMPLPDGLAAIPMSTCLPPSYRLRPITPAQHPDTRALNLLESKVAKLAKNQRLTAPGHWQDTRHVELDFDQQLDFEPGSVCELLPENSEEDVEQLLGLMGWTDEADQMYELARNDPNHQLLPSSWSRYASLRQIFRCRLDLSSVPSRSFIEWLSYFTTNPAETDRLREFCSADGQDDLYEYVNRPRRTILEVLSEFKSASIPLDYIHDIFPQIRPREFSIASSSKVFPRQIHLLVAVVGYKTRMSVPRKGLCTSWISKLEVGTEIPVRIKPGYMNFPANALDPVICIGPGTGIAPFRSLVQERAVSGLLNHLVIFGCRNEASDFYYREQWTRFERDGVCRLHWAASRDQSVKRYVQDEIEEHKDEVWDFIKNRNASIYISGSSGQMPKGVRLALKKVCESEGGMDEGQATRFVEKLEQSGRLQEETW